jgi:hypothetical protein
VSKNSIYSALLFVISTLVAISVAEAVLRIKNSSMKNYDIEMWRYAKELKTASEDQRLGHEHVKNADALLQSVNIRLNDRGTHRFDRHAYLRLAVLRLNKGILWPAIMLLYVLAITVSQGSSAKFIYFDF